MNRQIKKFEKLVKNQEEQIQVAAQNTIATAQKTRKILVLTKRKMGHQSLECSPYQGPGRPFSTCSKFCDNT